MGLYTQIMKSCLREKASPSKFDAQLNYFFLFSVREKKTAHPVTLHFFFIMTKVLSHKYHILCNVRMEHDRNHWYHYRMHLRVYTEIVHPGTSSSWVLHPKPMSTLLPCSQTYFTAYWNLLYPIPWYFLISFPYFI